MTKERLEELRKQEAEIYVVENKNIFKYKLKKKARPILCSDVLYIVSYDIPYEYSFDQIFETEADAEKELARQMWKEKTTAKRTERFEPPMWEEIGKDYNFVFIKHPEEQPIFFYTNKKKHSLIFIRDEYKDELIELFAATKENYEKACEIVRDLFKGEK